MSAEKVSQELFMRVKEGLDYYHLPSTFPIEATALLDKLINLIRSGSPQHSHNRAHQHFSEGLSTALKHEMSRITKQNNKLHMDLITAHQEIQSLSHSIHKQQVNKNSEHRQLIKLQGLTSQREQELIQEIQDVKYKYNQLMDFLHEGPQAERQYIKRLMKHKTIKGSTSNGQLQRHQNQHGHSLNHIADKTIHKHSQSQRKGQKHSNQTLLQQLQNKVRNREAEILRLQQLIEYDGLNLNKILKDFNNDLAKKQLKNAESKINYLQQSYQQVKKENSKMKGNNGSKEALRAEVQKCHKIIQKLKGENAQIRRKDKQINFDVQKHNLENQRKIDQVKAEKHKVQHQKNYESQINKELNKKIHFLQKQLSNMKTQLESENKKNQQKQQQNEVLAKNNQKLKLYYEYQIDTYKKKIEEQKIELEQSFKQSQRQVQQIYLLKKQNNLKGQSIANLQKIVNELIRKNSLLTDSHGGNLQSYLQKNQQIDNRRQLIDLEQQLIHSKNQKAQLTLDLRELQHKLLVTSKEAEKYRFEYTQLRKQTNYQQDRQGKLKEENQDLKHQLKRQQHQNQRLISQLTQTTTHKDSIIRELKNQNEKLVQLQKKLKLNLREIQIKTSEQQGILQITKLRLQQKEERLKQMERLLNETVQQFKSQSNQLSEQEHKNHQISRENHRLIKKYDQLQKQTEDFKMNSFKNYQLSINDNLNEVAILKTEISRLTQAEQRLMIRYEEVNGLMNLVRREKQLLEVTKITVERENDHLKGRLMEMQEIERSLVIQNQSLRNYSRRI